MAKISIFNENNYKFDNNIVSTLKSIKSLKSDEKTRKRIRTYPKYLRKATKDIESIINNEYDFDVDIETIHIFAMRTGVNELDNNGYIKKYINYMKELRYGLCRDNKNFQEYEVRNKEMYSKYDIVEKGYNISCDLNTSKQLGYFSDELNIDYSRLNVICLMMGYKNLYNNYNDKIQFRSGVYDEIMDDYDETNKRFKEELIGLLIKFIPVEVDLESLENSDINNSIVSVSLRKKDK